MFTDQDRANLNEALRIARIIDLRVGGDGRGNGLEPFSVRLEAKVNELITTVAAASGVSVATVEQALKNVLLRGVQQ